MRTLYCYSFKTAAGYDQMILDLDLLEAVTFATKHAQENPDVTQRKIVDRDLREVCVFRDTALNGK